MKTKILFIHHGTGVGGAPISLLNLINGINKDCFDCKVLFLNESSVIQMFKDSNIDTEIINIPYGLFAHNKSAKISWIYMLNYSKIYYFWNKVANNVAKNILINYDFDILHLNSHVLSSWAFAANKLGKKVVLHNREAISRGYLGFRYNILKKLLQNNCDAIINISNDNFKRLDIKEKSYVVYNSVPIPSHYREPFDFEKKNVNVLYLGGESSIKGFEVILNCLEFLNKNIVITFAGAYNKIGQETSFKDLIKRFIKLTFYRNKYLSLIKLHKAKNVHFVGVISNPLEYIDNCDMLITPFTIEHFSRPAIEAFAYGKPVIASNVVGMDEIVDDGINGILIEKNNSKALAEAINYLSTNPTLAVKMGMNGRKKANERFDPLKNAKKVEKIYIDLMKK